jgi:hypothetical protein
MLSQGDRVLVLDARRVLDVLPSVTGAGILSPDSEYPG